MTFRTPEEGKKYFTPAEANATLPLVRAIVRDITELAPILRDREERLARIAPKGRSRLGESYEEEQRQIEQALERDRERMQELVRELSDLGIELKDFYTGLVDFPCWMNNHEVYLCWRLGEPEVAHWHELDAGFAGRQKLPRTEVQSPKFKVQR
jgi:hypothetical protein